MEIRGLTDFQKSLIKTEKNLEKTMRETVRAQGNKATAHIRKKARKEVKEQTGNYHKKFKRGKVFKGHDGAITTRALNTSPHGHLIEDGHIQIVNGQEVGFVKGKKIMKKGMAEYEAKGTHEKEFADAIDRLLRKNKL